MTGMSFLEHLDGTGLRDCFDFWLARRDGRRPPQKKEINPSQMPHPIMPNLFLYELTPENRFRCRLAGSAIRQAFGLEPTGRYLDELVHLTSAVNRTALFRAVLEKELPLVYGGKLAEGGKLWMPFKRLLLPVVDEHDLGRFVFGMVIFLGAFNEQGAPSMELSNEFEVWASADDLAARPVAPN